MCTDDPSHGLETLKPEIRLSNLIKKRTGVDILPEQLRKLIMKDWVFVASLAHAVHDSVKGLNSIEATTEEAA